jgi:serine/threonine protein kinase
MVVKMANVQDMVNEIMQFWKNPGACPQALLEEVVKSLDPGYRMPNLVAIRGEGAIIQVNKNLCLKLIKDNLLRLKKRGFTTNYLQEVVQEPIHTYIARLEAGLRIQKEVYEVLGKEKINFYVPRFIKVIKQPYCVVQEWVTGISILQYIKEKNDLYFSLSLFLYLLEGIQKIHELGIIHRDIKTDNILYGEIDFPIRRNQGIYLLDWSLAKKVDRYLTIPASDILGTPGYSSPGQLNDACFTSYIDDIFSLGIVFWEFVRGCQIPPIGGNYRDTYSQMGKNLDDLASRLPNEFIPIFKRATNLDTKKRYQRVSDFAEDIEKCIIRNKTIRIEKPDISEDKTDIVLLQNNIDYCESCENKDRLCYKVGLCNLIILAIQDLRKEGYI